MQARPPAGSWTMGLGTRMRLNPDAGPMNGVPETFMGLPVELIHGDSLSLLDLETRPLILD